MNDEPRPVTLPRSEPARSTNVSWLRTLRAPPRPSDSCSTACERDESCKSNDAMRCYCLQILYEYDHMSGIKYLVCRSRADAARVEPTTNCIALHWIELNRSSWIISNNRILLYWHQRRAATLCRWQHVVTVHESQPVKKQQQQQQHTHHVNVHINRECMFSTLTSPCPLSRACKSARCENSFFLYKKIGDKHTRTNSK